MAKQHNEKLEQNIILILTMLVEVIKRKQMWDIYAEIACLFPILMHRSLLLRFGSSRAGVDSQQGPKKKENKQTNKQQKRIKTKKDNKNKIKLKSLCIKILADPNARQNIRIPLDLGLSKENRNAF